MFFSSIDGSCVIAPALQWRKAEFPKENNVGRRQGAAADTLHRTGPCSSFKPVGFSAFSGIGDRGSHFIRKNRFDQDRSKRF